MLKSYPETEEFEKKIDNWEKKKKSEVTAVLLSAFFPGAGSLYSGDKLQFWLMLPVNMLIIYCIIRFGVFNTVFFYVGSFYRLYNQPVLLYYAFALWEALRGVRAWNFNCKMEIEQLEKKKTEIVIDKARRNEWAPKP
jgi:TM2 domain-containing membrane protein YozV